MRYPTVRETTGHHAPRLSSIRSELRIYPPTGRQTPKHYVHRIGKEEPARYVATRSMGDAPFMCLRRSTSSNRLIFSCKFIQQCSRDASEETTAHWLRHFYHVLRAAAMCDRRTVFIFEGEIGSGNGVCTWLAWRCFGLELHCFAY